MKKVLQVWGVLSSLFILTVGNIPTVNLDNIDIGDQLKIETITTDNPIVTDCFNVDVVTDEIHTLMRYDDTEEQIQEEIRLGKMELLAQLVHAEAGTEDLKGKRLVADVVLNRIESSNFPNNIEDVIYQNITVNGVTYWQFDTAGNGMIDKAGWEMTESDYVAAQLEYEAEVRMDPSIMYFRTGHYHPYGTPAYKYGRHYFNYE